jgi:hypothetical protein
VVRHLVVVLAPLLLGCGQDSAQSAPIETTTVVATSDPAASTTNQAPHPTTADSTSTSTAATGPNDPADAYLGETTEIYRRVLPDGQDFFIRLSKESYASVFGLVWNAPTGSADECLGDHALFVGVPGDVGPWGSAWVVGAWFDEIRSSGPVVLQESMWAADSAFPTNRYLVLRANADAKEVVLESEEGTELDRSTVVEDVAMFVVDPQALGDDLSVNNLRVTVIATDGQPSAPVPILPAAANVSADCGPGDPPSRPLPEPGVQPEDPAKAETQIRQRHAMFVDRSIPSDQKPADLLDDDTGVQDAMAKVGTGQYRDLVDSATYSIDELVFTRPDEAWFRYTITTTTSTYSVSQRSTARGGRSLVQRSVRISRSRSVHVSQRLK